MTKKEAQENESKKNVVLRIAIEAGALEHCEEHDTATRGGATKQPRSAVRDCFAALATTLCRP